MECHGIKGAFQSIDVRIGWYPAVAERPTAVRTSPRADGRVLKEIPKGGGVGMQSVRNPTGSATPSRRPSRNGYVWCYTRAGSVTGWVFEDDLGPDEDSLSKPPLNGPAGYDFEVYRTLPQPKKPSGCGKRSLTQRTLTVAAREVFLRYSPRGTAFHYLHRGEKVKVLIALGPHGFIFVEVVEGETKGSRGWTTAGALD